MFFVDCLLLKKVDTFIRGRFKTITGKPKVRLTELIKNTHMLLSFEYPQEE